jgi:SNF2 family DNA or RNA helicase
MTDVLVELCDKPSLQAIGNPEARAFAAAIAKRTPWPKGIKPYGFQQVGIAYAAASKFRCMIGDAMGLGKTVQAIGALNLGTQLNKPLTPALVVAPASVTGEWLKALRHFGIGFDVVMLEHGNERPPRPRRNTVYVTSWNLLRSIQDYHRQLKLRMLILDESQTAKEPAAQCTRAAMRLARRVPHVLELSGTPSPNRVEELWTQLWMLDPETFESAEMMQDVGELLPLYMVRRLKTDVLQELPPKIRKYQAVTLSAEEREAYDQVEASLPALVSQSLLRRQLTKAARLYRRARRRGAAGRQAAEWAVARVNEEQLSADAIARVTMVKIGHLRRSIAALKVPHAMKFVEDHFDRSRRPLVIFVEHRKPLRELGKALRKKGLRWSYIDGTTPKAQRTRRVEAFQEGRLQVLVCTQAAYSGITLTRARRVLFLERWWVPSREEQAEDRLHRIGQTKTVEVTYLMAEDTIDEYVTQLVDTKRETLAALLGEEQVHEHHTASEEVLPRRLHRTVAERLMARMHLEVDVTVTLPLLRAYLKRRRKRR